MLQWLKGHGDRLSRLFMTDIRFDITRRFVLGLGCERCTPANEVAVLAGQPLALVGIEAGNLAAVASIDTRRAEPAILAVAVDFGLPLVFFNAATLERETPRLRNPSPIVFARVGCHGVAEAAALAVIGEFAELVVPKIKSAHATAAIACLLLQKE